MFAFLVSSVEELLWFRAGDLRPSEMSVIQHDKQKVACRLSHSQATIQHTHVAQFKGACSKNNETKLKISIEFLRTI